MKNTLKSIFLLLFTMTLAFTFAACNTQPAEAVDTNAETVQTEEKERILKEGEIIVSSFAELEAAVNDKEITGIYIGADIDIANDLSFEREDDLVITVDSGNTLTISATFIPVGCSIINDGIMVINGTFERGISNLTNNGSFTINNGGMVTSGQSDTLNQGEFIVATGGNLSIERGSIFNNSGSLVNDGYILITDGGQLNYEGGSITNNGTLDLFSYFNGDITVITGTGTLNDNRE
ncbi:MAG: pectate lyase-like adhesive domain-containing protein [Anaerolineaceae bacterium]